MATQMNSVLQTRPLSPHIGVEVTGIDLSRPLDAALRQRIIDLWHAHVLLLFRGQDIGAEDQLRFAGYFGPIGERSRDRGIRPEEQGDDYNSKVVMIGNIRNDAGEVIGTLPDGEMWFHYDSGYVEVPNMATLLYGIQIPSTGGNTMIANMYTAYDRIPEALKQKLTGRRALNVYDYEPRRRADHKGDLAGAKTWLHPVFTTNPATGRKALYTSRLMTARIEGLPDDESDAVLEQLFDLSEDPEIRYDHVWAPGDLLLWDNRCSIHARTDFPAEETRQLRRCAVLGETPYE